MRILFGRGATAGLLAGAVVTVAAFSAGPASGISGPPAPTDGYGFVAQIQLRPDPRGPRPGDPPSSDPYRACSGVLVDPQWVATAGACHPDVWADWPPIATATVGGHARQVVQRVSHPDRDFWLFKLDKPVDVAPVRIATTAPSVGETLQVAGFGRTATEWVPERVHVGSFRVEAVSAAAVDIVSNQSPPSSVCKGDAGGPALRSTASGLELIALNDRSWQAGCLGVPETETRTGASEIRLDNVKDWIRQTVSGSRFVRLGTSAAVLDTRSGIGATAGPRGAGSTTTFPVTGVGGIPETGVTAVLVDVTAVTSTASTSLTLWPSGRALNPRPDVSMVSAAANQAISNTAIVPVSSTGDISVWTSGGGTHIVVDVEGYYTTAANTGGGFVSVDHTRVVDTRNGLGGVTGTVPAGQSRTFPFTGGVIPSGAAAAFLDLIVTGATARGWIGTGSANRSVMDYAVGTTSHAVAVQLDASGRATFTNNTGSAVHLAMTATGYFTGSAATGMDLRTMTAERKLDTRANGGAPVAANGVVDVVVGMPAGTTALVNLTVVNNTAGGYLRAWPLGGAEPTPSLTTYPDPNTVARSGLAAVKVGTDGKIRVKNTSSGTAHIVVDLQGWYAQPLP